ncbi:MAG: hypothetical protein PVH88_27785 [Ignavibacteria bacterium]|jgi:hypothetical protein
MEKQYSQVHSYIKVIGKLEQYKVKSKESGIYPAMPMTTLKKVNFELKIGLEKNKK